MKLFLDWGLPLSAVALGIAAVIIFCVGQCNEPHDAECWQWAEAQHRDTIKTQELFLQCTEERKEQQRETRRD